MDDTGHAATLQHSDLLRQQDKE